MRIILSAVPFDRGRSGISVYCRHLIPHLRKAGHELTLILEKDAEPFFPEYRKIVLPRICSIPAFSMLYHLFLLPRRIRREDYDFCILCAANRRAMWKYPVLTAAVVHDLSQYHVKNKYDPLRMFYLKKLLPHFTGKAHCVVAVSAATAADLKRFWHIPEGKLRVVHNGLSLPENDDAIPGFERRYGLSRPYILYISRLEHPGKNHLNLIRAYRSLPEELSRRYDLVLPGEPWNGAEEIFRAAAVPGGGRIRFPGFVPDGDLPELYRRAACYVFPSFFEGFGLSLLEAMHYGIPCACSDGSALKEIGRDAARLFDPADVNSIRDALADLLTSEELRKRLVELGRRRAAKFTWEETARHFESIYSVLLHTRCRIFGVTVSNHTMDDALERIDEMIRAAGRDGHCRFAAFVNAHCLNLAWRDHGLIRILGKADAVWPDGSGVRMAGRLLGFTVRENVNGTDMFPRLCRTSHSIYLLGAAPGVAEQAMINARKLFPAVRLLGADPGYFTDAESEKKIIDRINLAAPDILLVGMGMPKQEKWISAHRRELRCGVAIAVGGLFDFVSGRIPRAPGWMRRAGMEWLFRLYREPRRLFARYVIGNPLFILRVLQYRGRLKKLEKRRNSV